MTDSEIDNEIDAEEDKEGKGKKGKGERGTLGRGEISVTQGFYEKMFAMGASAAQIKEVLSSWRYLWGDGLTRAFSEFSARMARASAHVQVEIDQGKNFSVLEKFFVYVKAATRAPEQKHSLDQQNRPGQSGPNPR